MTRPDVAWSVEQLAAKTDLPTSTIRMYQTKGLLHPPARVGRTARYDQTHLERLRLIQRLQTRGFSLPAVAELLHAREAGVGVAEVLGLDSMSVGSEDGPDDWVPLTLRTLHGLVPLRDMRPALLRRATDLGLLRWRRGRPYTRRWALDSGKRLAMLGVPSPDVLDEFVRLRAATDRIAQDFLRLFDLQLWSRLSELSTQDDQLSRFRGMLVDLIDTAELVVVGALRESIRDAAEEFARRHDLVPSDGSQPVWDDRPVPVPAERRTNAGPRAMPAADADIAEFLRDSS